MKHGSTKAKINMILDERAVYVNFFLRIDDIVIAVEFLSL